MTRPVTYLEINSPDLARSSAFFSAAFGWELQPFVSADHLVAPHGDGPGIDTALLPSQDARPGPFRWSGWTPSPQPPRASGSTAERSSSSRSPSPGWAAAATSSTPPGC
jgi:hypothetical protein